MSEEIDPELRIFFSYSEEAPHFTPEEEERIREYFQQKSIQSELGNFMGSRSRELLIEINTPKDFEVRKARGLWFRSVRKSAGYSQESFAEYIGIDHSTIAKIEAGIEPIPQAPKFLEKFRPLVLVDLERTLGGLIKE